MTIGVIDIGGTTIKFAVYQNQHLEAQMKVATPKTLTAFYELLNAQVTTMKTKFAITGIGISSPGSVDQNHGVVEGTSAIPYIHRFPIVSALEKLFGLPVTIENDANCAALAESRFGVAQGISDVAFLVLGTGVGGAIILDGKIRHGKHLLAGEFGYMLDSKTHSVSTNGTIVNAAKRFNRTHHTQLDGQGLYALAETGDPDALEARDDMLYTIAKTIFNLQYALDPDVIVLAGGISANPRLLPDLKAQLDRVMVADVPADIYPDVRIAHFTSAANLYGAAVNYEQQKH